ncbi:unnamed protein product [Sphagnum jensenii]|uniref:Protein kinase domain-containing protein n=1 Tax=Sphagnum jensenii TaxID=128206 RepID=A0ABP0W655_9BRYO
MEVLMKTRKETNSAICRVFGVGIDVVGNAWVVMERMAGDLRTLIDRRMRYLEDGQMPFDYNNTITMMMHIAKGMEDLHRCDLIHADLKASNILVTPVTMDRREEVDGSQQASESTDFYVKIGDFETSDGVVGSQQPKRFVQPQVEMEGEEVVVVDKASESSNLVAICWEEVAAQGLGTEAFLTWKVKVVLDILPEILPIVKVLLHVRKLRKQDSKSNISNKTMDRYASLADLEMQPIRTIFYGVLCIFARAWFDHVSARNLNMEIEARELLKRGKSIMKPCTEEAYYLLGPRGKYWLKEILATSKEWQTFQTTCHAWRPGNKYERREFELEQRRCDLEKLQFFLDTTLAKIYLQLYNGRNGNVAMGSIEAWEEFELKEIIILRMGQGFFPGRLEI